MATPRQLLNPFLISYQDTVFFITVPQQLCRRFFHKHIGRVDDIVPVRTERCYEDVFVGAKHISVSVLAA